MNTQEKKDSHDTEGRRGGGRQGARERLILHFVHVVRGRQLTFSADTLGWVTTAKWGAVPKDYMKRATCFKVVQLDYPFHFASSYAIDKQTSQIHMLLSAHREGEEERKERGLSKCSEAIIIYYYSWTLAVHLLCYFYLLYRQWTQINDFLRKVDFLFYNTHFFHYL